MGRSVMTYDEWEVTQKISPSSPESWYAEKAWNKAEEQLCTEIERYKRAFEEQRKDMWNLTEKVIPNIRHERNVLQKICAERSDQLDKIYAENEALKDTLRRILGWRETDLPEGDRCAKAIEYIESVAGAALRGED